MNVLIAPDKFKGTLSAREAAEAMADGVRRVLPDAHIPLFPMADGGDGTVDTLVAAAGGEAVAFRVTGPLGEPVDAEVGLLGGGRAALEMSSTSGLRLLGGRAPEPLSATTFGLGELLKEIAGRALATEVMIGIGGSATTDGGAGAAAAAGWRFLDANGSHLTPEPRSLIDLARIDGSGFDPGIARLSIVGARDVDNPLIGPRGAARVFAPQKGASADEVEFLERALHRLADCIEADLGVDVRDLPGAGAAGGLGAGLVAFFGARLEDGFEAVAEAVGLERALARADLALTGEGRLDEQTLSGKVPAGVAGLAGAARVPCVVVAGEVALTPEQITGAGFESAASVIDQCVRGPAFERAADALAQTVASLLSARAAPH
jgi:glycerate kinase